MSSGKRNRPRSEGLTGAKLLRDSSRGPGPRSLRDTPGDPPRRLRGTAPFAGSRLRGRDRPTVAPGRVLPWPGCERSRVLLRHAPAALPASRHPTVAHTERPPTPRARARPETIRNCFHHDLTYDLLMNASQGNVTTSARQTQLQGSL